MRFYAVFQLLYHTQSAPIRSTTLALTLSFDLSPSLVLSLFFFLSLSLSLSLTFSLSLPPCRSHTRWCLEEHRLWQHLGLPPLRYTGTSPFLSPTIPYICFYTLLF